MLLFLLFAFPLLVPKDLRSTHAWIPDDARLNGIAILGGPGSGKSRLMGRLIAFLDFLRGLPVVILDPIGGTIDNFLHRIALLPREQQERMWKRVIYIDMSGQWSIVPFPLYYRLSETESLASIVKRYIEVIRRLDPALSGAAMEGLNSVIRLGTYVGIILAALGLQITEADDLIRHPAQWRQRLNEALTLYPEVRPAVEFFLEWGNDKKTKPDYRARRSESFLTKNQMFQLDPGMRAMFGASTPGIDWAQVVQQGYTVLIDFRHEQTEEYRRFKLLWVFMYLFTYLNLRGPEGRTRPISLIIDELTEFVNFRTSDGKSVLADEVEKLVSVIGRNYGVWLTLAAQGLSQFDPRIQKMLGRMGSQIIGNITDHEEALYLARQFIPYDPYLEKKRENVWMSVTAPAILTHFGAPEGPVPRIIDKRIHEFSPDEQDRLGMNRFREIDELTFFTKLATREGRLHAPLRKMSIASIDPGLYVDSFPTSDLRQALSIRYGLPQETLLAEIDNRLKQEVNQKKVKTKNEAARLNTSSSPKPYAPADTPKSDTDAPVPPPSAPTGAADEDPWQA